MSDDVTSVMSLLSSTPFVSSEPVKAEAEPKTDTPPEVVKAEAAPEPKTDTPPEEDPKIGVELDKNGTPWIEAVHAGTKKKTADGVWKKRRGVDDDVLAAAEAEARAKLAGTPDPVIPDDEPAAVEQPDLPGTAPVNEPEGEEISLDMLGEIYTKAVEVGAVTPEEILAIYKNAGCDDPTDITTNALARRKVAGELNRRMALKPAGLPGS